MLRTSCAELRAVRMRSRVSRVDWLRDVLNGNRSCCVSVDEIHVVELKLGRDQKCAFCELGEIVGHVTITKPAR